jgi:hypothetical protein
MVLVTEGKIKISMEKKPAIISYKELPGQK